MSLHREICRLCLQKADEYDVQNIDKNVFPLMKIYFCLQNLPFEPLENHVVCKTCITILKKMELMSRQVKRFNTALYLAQKKCKQTIFNLRQLKRFKNLPRNVAVCRQCFEPTNKIALYLYDHEKNILPKEFIEVMFKYCKFYTRFDRTEKQVMCFNCWENLQACYNFQKHLNTVRSKIRCYQNRVETVDLSKEDLFNIIENWEELGEKLDSIDLTLDLPERAPRTCRRNIMADISKNSCTATKEVTEELNNDQIPDLTPHIEEEPLHNKAVKKLKTNDEIPVLTASKVDEFCDEKDKLQADLTIKHRKKKKKRKKLIYWPKKKKKINNSKKEPKEEMPLLTSSVDKIEDKKVEFVGYRTRYSLANKSSEAKNTSLKPSKEYVSCRTRSRPTKSLEDDTDDLLILQREEIIKRKPIRKTKAPETTTKNNTIENGTMEILGSSFDHSGIVTFDMDVQVKRELIEQEEVQIKREVLSDSEDYFSESAGGPGLGNSLDFTESDQCPNLVSFIKTELPDDSEMDEEPPELEFQGPCPCPSVVTSTPNLNLPNSFRLDTTKFSMIRSVDEKRTVLNFVDESNAVEEQASKKNDKVSGEVPRENPGAASVERQNYPVVSPQVNKDPTNHGKEVKKMPTITKEVGNNEQKVNLQNKGHSLQNVSTTPASSASKQEKKISKQSTSKDTKFTLKNGANDSKQGIKMLYGHEYRAGHQILCFHCKQTLEREPGCFCTKCGKTYHADCTDLSTTYCKHNIVLKRNCQQVLVTIPFCGICSNSIARWITCKKCRKSFHPNCIYKQSAKSETPECLHKDKNEIFDSFITVIENTGEGVASAPYAVFEDFEKKQCNVCKVPPLKWVSCLLCSGHFHSHCFSLLKSGINSVTNNCHHSRTKLLHSKISLSWKQVALFRANEDPKAQTVIGPKFITTHVCASCNKSVDIWVRCKKCHFVFHPRCFNESRTTRCDHMDERNLGIFMALRHDKIILLADLYTAIKFEAGCSFCRGRIKQPQSLFCTICKVLVHRGCHKRSICRHTDHIVTVSFSNEPVSLKNPPNPASSTKLKTVNTIKTKLENKI